MTPILILANLVLFNGKIWTGDAANRAAQAVAIEENRIVAVGTNDSVLAAAPRDAQRIDLHGRLAVPGFIDDHVHFIDGGFELSRVQLRDAASPEEFARRIGVSQNYLSVMEHGGAAISAGILLAISREFGKSMEWVLTGED